MMVKGLSAEALCLEHTAGVLLLMYSRRLLLPHTTLQDLCCAMLVLEDIMGYPMSDGTWE
jgi:hypothetical protein